MSAKSKKSSKTIDRAFAPRVLAEARAWAARYQVVLSCDEGRWYGRGLELPHVFADGQTPAECVANTLDAFAGAVAHLLETGQRPPTPANAGTRTLQVNVRLTADEKALLETSARDKGFNGLSDFIRAAALEAAR